MMKLQAAIDRVSLDKATQLANQLAGIVDIVEFGTSLVKDYGLYAIKNCRLNLKSTKLLIDLKTNDEGPYEFEKGFEAGGDLLTVMGFADKATLDQVYAISEKYHKTMLIDLMGMTDQQIGQLSDYPKAIYNLHHAHDAGRMTEVSQMVSHFRENFTPFKKLAIAGSIDLEQTKILAKQGLTDLVIVGSKIVKADDPIASAKKFRKVIDL